MAGPAEIVNDTYVLAQSYATAATNGLDKFVDTLNSSLYVPPRLDVTWKTLAAPTLRPLGTVPTMPTIAYVEPGNRPGEFTETLPIIDIDTFNEDVPQIDLPVAPVLTYGAVPSVPDISPVQLPDLPTLDAVDTPVLLSLQTVSFPGIDLHADWLDNLGNVPTLDILEPTPYTFSRGPDYASLLLDNLKSRLNERMAGGSGLPPVVEQAIWDRARAREISTARGAEAEVMRNSDALGYVLPPGVLAQQLREAQFATAGKIADFSRDVAIKQADMEQANLRDTIASGLQLENQLMQHSLQLEQMSFESAKALADNAIQVYNGKLQHFQTLLEGYKAYAAGYKTLIDAEMAKVEVYKAQLSGESTKADINRSLVDQYKAAIEARMSQVEIYKAQVSAAQTLVELEKAKISAAGEQIHGFVAQVNAETAKVEAYKASVEAQNTKHLVYKTRADIYSTRVMAQAEKSRALVSRYSAIVQAKAAEWDGYRARVQAESVRLEALGKQSFSMLDGYKAEAAATTAEAEMNTKIWESGIRQYEASQSITLQAGKANNDAIMWAQNTRLDAAKAGTQVYAQLTASAYSMIHTSAGISSSGSTGVSYSYSGQVNGSPGALTMA